MATATANTNANANGVLTPPTYLDLSPTSAAPNSSANKRKREDDADNPAPQSPTETTAAPSRSRQIQRDILDWLRQHDTNPSFLDYETGLSHIAHPPSKKARLTSDSSESCISARLSSGVYSTLDLLKDDAARVSKALEMSARTNVKNEDSNAVHKLSVEQLKQIQRVRAFEQLVIEVAERESRLKAVHAAHNPKTDAHEMANGIVPNMASDSQGRLGAVLTLFGNAPTPKQLFSSMQHPASDKEEAVNIKSELPVDEMSLPNGLSATKILPPPVDASKPGPTFEEAFAPPYSLPTLHPPKSLKRSSTRDTTISWEFKDPISRGSRKGGWTVQSMTTGDWLGYGGVDAIDGVSPRERRKQRDRALSGGMESGKDRPSVASLEEQQAKEEEALFRRAYSSFAPSHDNTKAVIPAEIKSMMWWHKVGDGRYQEIFELDPRLTNDSATTVNQETVDGITSGDDDLGRVVEMLDDLEDEPWDVDPVTSKTDVDDVLRNIADLLQALASHQRIRNAALTSTSSASRTSLSPAPILASRIGKPDEPADEEVNTYHALRRELAYLILKLPPYAVAKLDGDQLAELGVSRVIKMHMRDVKGTMEEDQVARLARHNAIATAAGIASLTRGSSTSGQHYNTTALRTPAIGQAANTRYGGSSQYAARTPAAATQYQRTVSNQSAYGTPSVASRPSYGTQQNLYTRTGASQFGQQYHQTQRPPSAQTPPVYGAYNQPQYQPTRPQSTQPVATTYSNPATQAQQSYQTRPQIPASANPLSYQANNSSSTPSLQRTASPGNVQPRPIYQAPAPANSTSQVQPQPAPGPDSGRAAPNYPPSLPQTPVNGFLQQRPPPLTQPSARLGSETPGPVGQGNGA